MFYFKLIDQYKRGVEGSAPFPRGSVSIASSVGSHSSVKFGAFAVMGAALIGGFLMTANLAQQPGQSPEVASSASENSKAEEATKALAIPAPTPDRIMQAPTVIAASANPDASVDMATTGAISADPVKTLHRKPVPRKKRPNANTKP